MNYKNIGVAQKLSYIIAIVNRLIVHVHMQSIILLLVSFADFPLMLLKPTKDY